MESIENVYVCGCFCPQQLSVFLSQPLAAPAVAVALEAPAERFTRSRAAKVEPPRKKQKVFICLMHVRKLQISLPMFRLRTSAKAPQQRRAKRVVSLLYGFQCHIRNTLALADVS